MAARKRRRSSKRGPAPIEFPIPLSWLGVGLLVAILAANPRVLLLIAVIGAIAFVGWRSFTERQRVRRDAALMAELNEAALRYRAALTAQFRQSCRHDAFGDPDESRWDRLLDEFVQTKFCRGRAEVAHWLNGPSGHDAVSELDWRVRNWVAEQDGDVSARQASDTSPIGYEQHCADLLRASGWTVHLTPVTGDGGADLIAARSGTSAVIQCKRYAKPVGNRAVQEAYTARALYGTAIACVVAPQGFTRQAEREAFGLGVRLLHHSALPGLSIDDAQGASDNRTAARA